MSPPDAEAAARAQRLFVAWLPDRATDDRLTALVELLQSRLPDPGYRWSRASHRHLTLRFLGDTLPDRADAVTTRLAGVVAGLPVARGHVAGWQYWPSVQSPRVLVARVESGGAIERLAEGIESAAHAAGYPREPHRFRAHLTLARIGRLRTAAKPFLEPPPRIDMVLDELALVASELRPEGSRYTVLRRWPLGK